MREARQFSDDSAESGSCCPEPCSRTVQDDLLLLMLIRAGLCAASWVKNTWLETKTRRENKLENRHCMEKEGFWVAIVFILVIVLTNLTLLNLVHLSKTSHDHSDWKLSISSSGEWLTKRLGSLLWFKVTAYWIYHVEIRLWKVGCNVQVPVSSKRKSIFIFLKFVLAFLSYNPTQRSWMLRLFNEVGREAQIVSPYLLNDKEEIRWLV